MFLLAIFFVFIIGLISWYQANYRQRNKLLAKFPSPKRLPLIHNTLQLLGMSPKQFFDWIEANSKTYGSVYLVSLGILYPGFVIVSNFKVIEAVLSSKTLLDKTNDYDLLKPWIGTGLLISTGKKWFQRRKLLTPGFHFQILERFVKIMDAHAKVFLDKISKLDGKQVDMFPLSNLYSLDTVCECAMGVNIHAQTKDSEYLKAVKEIAIIVVIRTFDLLKRMDFTFQFTEMYQREQKCLKVLHNFTDSVIQSRRNDLINNNKEPSDVQDEIGTKKKKALLDILLNSTIDGKPLTNLEIREEVDTFMFAGHDTTTSGISFVFYCIAKYKDVQQKVYEEVMEVLGDDEEVTVQKLNNLHYTELVIKESLRMFPPVPYYGRQLNSDLTVEGYTFPKGLNVYVSPYLMGRNPNIFTDPETFNPHRFEVETTYDKVNPYTYVPFSAGPRNCIGQKLAQYEIRTIISKVVKNYRLTLANENENLPLTLEVVMRPLNGVLLNISKRH